MMYDSFSNAVRRTGLPITGCGNIKYSTPALMRCRELRLLVKRQVPRILSSQDHCSVVDVAIEVLAQVKERAKGIVDGCSVHAEVRDQGGVEMERNLQHYFIEGLETDAGPFQRVPDDVAHFLKTLPPDWADADLPWSVQSLGPVTPRVERDEEARGELEVLRPLLEGREDDGESGGHGRATSTPAQAGLLGDGWGEKSDSAVEHRPVRRGLQFDHGQAKADGSALNLSLCLAPQTPGAAETVDGLSSGVIPLDSLPDPSDSCDESLSSYLSFFPPANGPVDALDYLPVLSYPDLKRLKRAREAEAQSPSIREDSHGKSDPIEQGRGGEGLVEGDDLVSRASRSPAVDLRAEGDGEDDRKEITYPGGKRPKREGDAEPRCP